MGSREHGGEARISIPLFIYFPQNEVDLHSCPSVGVGILLIMYIRPIFKLWILEALFFARD
jgi:hypothetical protein